MSVRHFRETDAEAINRLFDEVFHKRRPEEAWRWKFLDSPGAPAMVLLFEEAEEVVGHLAALPRQAKVGGEELTVAPRADTMVSPRFQGHGVYKALLLRLAEDATAQGISFLYGFPNPKKKDLLGGYQFHPVLDIPRLVRVNRPANVAAARLPKGHLYRNLLRPLDRFWQSRDGGKAALAPDARVREVSGFGAETDRLWSRVSPGLQAAVRRDSRFLNWRYRDNRDFSYRMLGYFREGELLGYLVTSLREKEERGVKLQLGYLVDILAVEEQQVWQALIGAALEQLQEADLLSAWALPHMRFYQELKKAGFSHPDSPMTLVGWALEKAAEPLMQGENWYFTMGDTDSF